jgi:hypothetical protein
VLSDLLSGRISRLTGSVPLSPLLSPDLQASKVGVGPSHPDDDLQRNCRGRSRGK